MRSKYTRRREKVCLVVIVWGYHSTTHAKFHRADGSQEEVGRGQGKGGEAERVEEVQAVLALFCGDSHLLISH